MAGHPIPLVERWGAVLVKGCAARGHGYAMHAVANPEWLDLAMSGRTAVV
ncbi:MULTISPECIES: hypothetical protein [unclassified Pseudomonas]|nr:MULTISPECIES: hypothetical protein [unclassified Pseudomonas]